VKYGGESGDWFAMASEQKITVHNSEDARVVQELDCERNVLCLALERYIQFQLFFLLLI
jgi:hypothetical protein